MAANGRRVLENLAIGLLASLTVGAIPSHATFRYGDIQISGNLEEQTLIRTPEIDQWHPVQQRNTFRIQYEQQLVSGGKAFKRWSIPGISSASFFGYYRGVFDSIYYIQPGARLEASDGSTGGTFRDLDGDKSDIAFENVIREIFLDLKLSFAPVSFRIGRQQMNWGEADQFRALDSVNPIDLTWHLQQEAGLIGKVGFDELRIPAWTVKMLVALGDFGPFSQAYLEAFDIPFDFQPAYARFEPAPWSGPLRNPLRPGLVADGELLGLPRGFAKVQGCIDLTGNPENNVEALASGHAPDFSHAATTGFCNSANLPVSTIYHGLYDRRDPKDVNAFGARVGANAAGIGFTLAYMYRRHLGADIPSATLLKAPFDTLDRSVTSKFFFLWPGVHQTTDPILRKTQTVEGYLRVPAQFYYPYVHVAGLSANYFDPFTESVFTLEAAVTHGLPVGQPDLVNGNLMKKKDVVLAAVGIDRPTWIRWLNRRSTWAIVGQVDINWIPDHQPLRRAGTIPGTSVPNYSGDVGAPFITLIPDFVDGPQRIDKLKEVEVVSLLGAASFYRGGSFVPQIAWVSDWSYAPSMGFILTFDYLYTNNLIITPGISIFTNFGRIFDDAFGVGRLSQWDEVKLKVTYQF